MTPVETEPRQSSSRLLQDIRKSRLLKEVLRTTAVVGDFIYGPAAAHTRIMEPIPEYQCSREFRYNLRLYRNRLSLVIHTAILIHSGLNPESNIPFVVVNALNLVAMAGIAAAHMRTSRGLARFIGPYRNLTL